MPTTCKVLLDRARLPLNDAAGDRWPDAELIQYLREIVGTVRKVRPDLFFATLLEEPTVELDAPVPVPFTHHQTLVDYVTARAKMKDGDAAAGKVDTLLNLAVAGLR